MGKRKATRSEIIERNRKIVKDYEDGLSFEQLSEKYGLCVRTCYRALDEEQQAQRIAEEQDHANLVDKIVAEYQKNTAVRDIAEKYGVSIGYCSAIAVQAGISNKELSHRRITRRQQKRNDEIFEKYQNGIDAKDLAKACTISISLCARIRCSSTMNEDLSEGLRKTKSSEVTTCNTTVQAFA